MGSLTQPQREAAMAVLKTALSPQGYEKVQQIVEADETLKKGEGNNIFGRDLYYISFVGQPSPTEPWMIQFGGHHLGINVTMVCGNNGIWGLEKHPMRFLYGYDVAAELRPETRYEEVMRALGGHGELVRTPDELGPSLERAFSTPGPSLVNVLTDPEVAYPRSSNLA